MSTPHSWYLAFNRPCRSARTRPSVISGWRAPASIAACVVALFPVLGADPSVQAAGTVQSSDQEWGNPFCGGQPIITAVFDHEYPTYGCPPNGSDGCRGGNRIVRAYNDTTEPPRSYDGHNGWDYRTRGSDWVNRKHPVLAVADGEVVHAGWHFPGSPDTPDCSEQARSHARGYGLMVRIDHGSSESLYGHLSALRVKAGDRVTRGQWIATTGNTGNSGGPHLHFGAFRPSGPDMWHAFDPYGWNADWTGRASQPLPPETDPWVAVGGPRSRRLLRPGAPEPVPCMRRCSDPVVIDDADPGFTLGCTSQPCRWSGAQRGLDGHLYYTTPSGATPDHWARWTAPLPPGRYLVEVFIPASKPYGDARAVGYRMGEANDASTIIVDQHTEANVWIPVGTADFDGRPSVTLLNTSHIPGNWEYAGECRTIVADAVRFTRLCDPEAPPSSAAVGP